MKFNKIAIAIIPLFVLTSCRSSYVEGAFFDKKVLCEHEIEELPIPEGNILRYGDCDLYVNSSEELKEGYLKLVFEYINSSSFKHLYAVKSIQRGVVAPVLYFRAYVFESIDFDDFFYEWENSYWFIYSNNDIRKNDDELDIIDANIITIFLDKNTIKYNNKEFEMTYEIRLIKGETCFIVPE